MLLGVESSCDESALALFSPEEGVVWESVWSQIQTHTRHGGVVPELAVREHLQKFPQLLAELPIPLAEITKVGVTVGPGLVGSLAMGMSLAKALAMKLNAELLGVNHLRAHAHAVFIRMHRQNPAAFLELRAQSLPQLGLLVSGGNTLLYEMTLQAPAEPCLKILARTADDAAGEALDKAAKMLGLPYPGGPQIEKLAKTGDASKWKFPVPFKESAGLGFSFSGLKTALRYKLQAMTEAQVESEKANFAASFQAAVVESLTLMVRRALKASAYRSLALGGGVAQNAALRVALGDLARQNGVEFLPCDPAHCGDNAGMVAFAAWADPLGRREVKTFEPALELDAAQA